MKRIVLLFGIPFFSVSCYTNIKKPNFDLMNVIKKQASLDSSLKTSIEIIPKKYYFGTIKNTRIFSGNFYVKNIGNKDFNIVSIKSNCDCITTYYPNKKPLSPNESLKVCYKINVYGGSMLVRNSIIVIGNCQYGNQTFYFEGTIN